jgi:hypothetical protein
MNGEKEQSSYEYIHDDYKILLTETSNLFDRKHVNIEPHQLVWLDNNHKDDFLLHQFRLIIDYVKTFDNLNECQKYIEKTGHTTTFLITSRILGERILPHIHKYNHIRSVHIFCENKCKHQEWSSNFSKVCRETKFGKHSLNDRYYFIN